MFGQGDMRLLLQPAAIPWPRLHGRIRPGSSAPAACELCLSHHHSSSGHVCALTVFTLFENEFRMPPSPPPSPHSRRRRSLSPPPPAVRPCRCFRGEVQRVYLAKPRAPADVTAPHKEVASEQNTAAKQRHSVAPGNKYGAPSQRTFLLRLLLFN